MASIIDLLRQSLQQAVALVTYRCAYCDEGKCNMPHGPEVPVACWNCKDTHQCSSCNGNGIVSPGPFSTEVYQFVAPPALVLIGMRRGEQDFESANVALEWLIDYNAKVLAQDMEGIDPEEAMRKATASLEEGNALLSEMLEASPAPTPSNSALTPQELVELGLSPDEPGC